MPHQQAKVTGLQKATMRKLLKANPKANFSQEQEQKHNKELEADDSDGMSSEEEEDAKNLCTLRFGDINSNKFSINNSEGQA